jgi:hypothetical protein
MTIDTAQVIRLNCEPVDFAELGQLARVAVARPAAAILWSEPQAQPHFLRVDQAIEVTRATAARTSPFPGLDNMPG